MEGHTRRGFVAGLAGVLAGCVGEGTVNTSTANEDETETEARLSCSEPVTPTVSTVEGYPDWNPDPPGDLTADRAVEYVADFEPTYEERRLASGHPEATAISVTPTGDPTVERADGGFVVHYRMTGYYNRPVEYATATEHADLGYRASYFLARGVVVRATSGAGAEPPDPREEGVGEVVLCTAEGA